MDEHNQEVIVETSDTEEELKQEKYKWTKDRIFMAIIFTFVILATIAIYIMIIIDKTFLFVIVKDYFLKPIYRLDVIYKVLIFFGFMILQVIVAPIPSEIILISCGILFRWWGIPIGIAGSMISAVIAYYISKRGGRSIIDASSKKVKFLDRTIVIFDDWIKRWGIWAIIFGRAVPFIAFDNISYAAGLAKIKDWYYHLATFIGCFPRTAFFSYMGIKVLGENSIEELINDPTLIQSAATRFNTIFFSVFGAFIFIFILMNIVYYVRERRKRMIIESKLDEQENNLITVEEPGSNTNVITTEKEIKNKEREEN
ncbi:MAG: TVP38/TMEM64 family protein [Asgard group archaeon]|nr:TVP38/TMEM64 family protein [Asgard group archaeon]